MDMTISKMKGASAITLILLFILLSSFRINTQNTLGQRNTLNLWDAVEGTLIQTIQTGEYIWEAMLNYDGTVIAALYDDGILVSYDAHSGDILHTRTFMTAGDVRDPIIRPGFVPGQVFVLQYEQFWLWDFVADEILLEGNTEGQLLSILASPNGKRFLAITRQEQIIIFDTASVDVVASILLLPHIWDIQWSPDSMRIAVAHRTGFNVFDSEAGAKLFGVQDDRFSDVYSKVSWSPDGASLLALASPSLHYEDTEIFVIESKTLVQRLSIQFDQGVFSLDWNADSSSILTASYEMAGVSSHDAHTGDLIRSYGDDSSTAGFLSAGWNYDDTLVVGQGVTETGKEYIIWEAETGRRVQERIVMNSLIDTVWNVSKTRVMFSFWPSSIVDVIDLTQQNALRFTLVHQDTLQGAVWSTDGNRILTWTGRDIG
jgi:WD40 repeat protein